LYVYLGAILAFFLFAVVYYYLSIFRPLKNILFQMQALISGKTYKKIFTKRIDEIGILAYFFNAVTKGLSEVSYDIKDRERMKDELTIAAKLQRDSFPLENPCVPGLQIVAKNKPATELGGDSFNMFTHGDKTFIYIGDVTGHGVAAGLIMTMVNSLVTVFLDTGLNVLDIVIHLNKYIKKHVKKAMFMTMVMLCWDHKNQKLTYVGAGHEHIVVYRASSGKCDAILTGGVALGMVPDNSKIVAEKEIELADSDVVVLYTDGITEARNKADVLYGLAGLQKAVKEYAPQYSAEGINFHLAKDVSDYMEGHVQDDDMTLIVLKRDVKNVDNQKIIDKTIKWAD
ncbi:SpoIIE family protein phosphatase, partial [Candidatus Peregrinibacteria bacterium]|nr:SpoIIE family protein phosphatase [Candidatus Peregrinibacteria bacterium]